MVQIVSFIIKQGNCANPIYVRIPDKQMGLVLQERLLVDLNARIILLSLHLSLLICLDCKVFGL